MRVRFGIWYEAELRSVADRWRRVALHLTTLRSAAEHAASGLGEISSVLLKSLKEAGKTGAPRFWAATCWPTSAAAAAARRRRERESMERRCAGGGH